MYEVTEGREKKKASCSFDGQLSININAGDALDQIKPIENISLPQTSEAGATKSLCD